MERLGLSRFCILYFFLFSLSKVEDISSCVNWMFWESKFFRGEFISRLKNVRILQNCLGIWAFEVWRKCILTILDIRILQLWSLKFGENIFWGFLMLEFCNCRFGFLRFGENIFWGFLMLEENKFWGFLMFEFCNCGFGLLRFEKNKFWGFFINFDRENLWINLF